MLRVEHIIGIEVKGQRLDASPGCGELHERRESPRGVVKAVSGRLVEVARSRVLEQPRELPDRVGSPDNLRGETNHGVTLHARHRKHEVSPDELPFSQLPGDLG